MTPTVDPRAAAVRPIPDRPPSTGSRRAGQPPPPRAPGPHIRKQGPDAQASNYTATPQGAASLLVAALEHAWQTIRTRHPEVPEAVLVVASGAEGKRLNLGHFAPHRWQVAGADRHEVLVGGEGLQRGPLEVLGTLLHEAAHGLGRPVGCRTPAEAAATTAAATPPWPANSAWR